MRRYIKANIFFIKLLLSKIAKAMGESDGEKMRTQMPGIMRLNPKERGEQMQKKQQNSTHEGGNECNYRQVICNQGVFTISKGSRIKANLTDCIIRSWASATQFKGLLLVYVACKLILLLLILMKIRY